MKLLRVLQSAPVCLFFSFTLLAPALLAQANTGNAAEKPGFDGPAELPRIYVKSSLAETPSPGKQVKVKEGDNLQEAVNHAACGDTLQLQAGGAFQGMLRLPAKQCDDAHWITIRTGAPDAELPAEGTRIFPCYAGIESLPDRPAYKCPSNKNVMAKIIFAAKGGSGPIELQNGANHYRFIGIEFTRAPGGIIYNLVSTEKGGAADHIIFDRVWMHGTASDETTRGIMLSGDTYVAVVDSYFNDFKCVAMTGACVEAQDIAGGLGTKPQGPFKIVNNFLEAASQSVFFGGGAATVTPADIEIRHNYMYKPPTWRPGNPQFVGAPNGKPYIVKNLFELKNAQRVLFEGNVLENSWGGFTQTGFGIVLTPKNQGEGTCPVCQVTDVTIRYCKMSHVASGFQIGNGLSDQGAAPKAGERYSIHDVIIDDIQGKEAKGFGILAQISTAFAGKTLGDAPIPPLHDLKMDHITAFPPDGLLVVGGPVSGDRMSGFAFTNNLVTAGERPVGSTGGGQRNCAGGANRRGPDSILDACFTNYTFTHNGLIDAGGGWPKGNISVKNTKDARFADYRSGNGGDYRLEAGSHLKTAGSDGRDIGADIDAVNKATAGAQ
ncbi:MAG TPA: hypothetical protein VJQ82_08325 [Terriglobales bacterium]|nr:hypothetical protein [Terriglobales bacterium]